MIFVPVIIFDATYYLNVNAFFENFLEIVTYAVIGTVIATAVIAVLLSVSSKLITTDFSVTEYLTYSALISAIDPVGVIAVMDSLHVNSDLYNLVFGESTLNDGVAIVLYNVCKSIN